MLEYYYKDTIDKVKEFGMSRIWYEEDLNFILRMLGFSQLGSHGGMHMITATGNYASMPPGLLEQSNSTSLSID